MPYMYIDWCIIPKNHQTPSDSRGAESWLSDIFYEMFILFLFFYIARTMKTSLNEF